MPNRSNAVIHTGTTSATVIGPNRDLTVTGIYIPSDLVGTLTLAGLVNSSGSATDLVIPAATQGNVFSGIVEEEGMLFSPNLTATLSNATDIVVFMFKREG